MSLPTGYGTFQKNLRQNLVQSVRDRRQ